MIGVSVATVRGMGRPGPAPLPPHRRRPPPLRARGAARVAHRPRRPGARAAAAAPPPAGRPPGAPPGAGAQPPHRGDRRAGARGLRHQVETPVAPSSSAPAMRRLAVRFLRILTAGLETGRPGASHGERRAGGPARRPAGAARPRACSPSTPGSRSRSRWRPRRSAARAWRSSPRPALALRDDRLRPGRRRARLRAGPRAARRGRSRPAPPEAPQCGQRLRRARLAGRGVRRRLRAYQGGGDHRGRRR